MKKIFFISLGCPRNFVDTEEMLGIVSEAGYTVIPSEDEADYIVVNTCGFLKEARDEAIEIINSLNKKTKIIVTGCMVSKYRDELKKRAPNINYFLGSADIEKIIDLIETSENKKEIVSKQKSYLPKHKQKRFIATPNHYAYLKIAEGCAKRCSYCAIPAIKGPLRSKNIEQVIHEFNALLDQGVLEVILIAQDLGDFGKDLKIQNGLKILLREILKIKRDFWCRLMYVYPDEIDDELIKIIKSDPRICPYIDMPVQHINDDILKQMKRKTSQAQIEDLILKLYQEIPTMSIRTSLMVGFPGETDRQFSELLSFIKKMQLDNVGVFKFSREEGTLAAKMPDQIPEKIKQKRYETIMSAQQKIVNKRNERFIGGKLNVIIEDYHPDSDLLLRGRHCGQAPDIDGCVIINDWEKVDLFGEKYIVEITDISVYDLIGRVT